MNYATNHVHLPIRDLTPPSEGQVDLWLSRPGDLPLTSHTGPLDRKARVTQRRLQRRFFLRLLLGAYLGCPGKDVKLITNARGKPTLAAGDFNFSLSHSGDWLLIAVGTNADLGVDLEIPRKLNKARELARRYFTARESRWLEQQEPAAREHAFLRLWTAKEAMVKAAGTGLAGYIDQVEVDLDGWPSLRRLPGDWPPADRWSLLELELPDGLLGHLAVANADTSCVLHWLSP